MWCEKKKKKPLEKQKVIKFPPQGHIRLHSKIVFFLVLWEKEPTSLASRTPMTQAYMCVT